MAGGAVRITEDTNSVIAELGESSERISDIIQLITSVAEQTNLLALNATIEAARAGDAGKGFAVVASEVKQLSQEIARSTSAVSEQIGSIQSDIKKGVAGIQKVSSTIHQINDVQTAIALSVQEQAATAEEISQNINLAADGSSNISRTIEGVADAARYIARGAAMLKLQQHNWLRWPLNFKAWSPNSRFARQVRKTRKRCRIWSVPSKTGRKVPETRGWQESLQKY
jgi:methyl-accepting chemotaxis protein